FCYRECQRCGNPRRIRLFWKKGWPRGRPRGWLGGCERHSSCKERLSSGRRTPPRARRSTPLLMSRIWRSCVPACSWLVVGKNYSPRVRHAGATGDAGLPTKKQPTFCCRGASNVNVASIHDVSGYRKRGGGSGGAQAAPPARKDQVRVAERRHTKVCQRY